jgi:hypothetical protein
LLPLVRALARVMLVPGVTLAAGDDHDIHLPGTG